MTTDTTRVLQLKKAAQELPVNSINEATRAALNALVTGWHAHTQANPDKTHHLADLLQHDIAQVVKNLTALGSSLRGDEVEADRCLRKALGLPFEVPPFDDDIYEDWRGLASEFYPEAHGDELRQLTRDLYEEHQGVMPPGPLDYTR